MRSRWKGVRQGGGHWGILETAKPPKNSAKTENRTYSQNRKTQKPHRILKPKSRYYFLRKPKTGC